MRWVLLPVVQHKGGTRLAKIILIQKIEDDPAEPWLVLVPWTDNGDEHAFGIARWEGTVFIPIDELLESDQLEPGAAVEVPESSYEPLIAAQLHPLLKVTL